MSKDGKKNNRHSIDGLLLAYIGLLTGAGLSLAIFGSRSQWDPPGEQSWVAFPVLIALMVAAEYLFIRFRYRGDVDALNLVEAVIAPLALAFEPIWVWVAIVVGQLIAGLLRRNAAPKIAFNAAQWGLAGVVASAIITHLSTGPGVSFDEAPVIMIALAAAALVNQVAFTVVLAIANRKSPFRVVKELRQVIVPGWIAGWGMNSVIGVLFAMAYAGSPFSVFLFFVPLGVLHLAYRGYAASRSDRMRLSGLHRAARLLSGPLDPTEAIEVFLREVAQAFDARSAGLILRRNSHRVVHLLELDTGTYSHRTDESDYSLESQLMKLGSAKRFSASDPGPLATTLRMAGWRDCVAAPVSESEHVRGVVVVFDQVGLEGFEEGEVAILESMARQIAVTLAKGHLFLQMMEDRRRFAEIFESTSDGIATIDKSGVVRSWNPAMEKITGLPAAHVIGRQDALERLAPRDPSQTPVDIAGWARGLKQPPEVEITSASGEVRRLSCSYSNTGGEGETNLVVIARDVTPRKQIERLQKEVTRAAAAEAAQRSLVEQLQEAIMPSRPEIDSTDLGLCYVASDPTAPTGGDLYDWRLLPSGELHLAVIDVLGHGVTATKDAIDVIQTLRALAYQQTPLGSMISEADRLLSAQNPDLVATVIVGRYNPETGSVQLATGGHPPPLLIDPTGTREVALSGGAIGWPGAGSDRVCYLDLVEGETLVFYTDGIVETEKDILAGTEALMQTAQGLVNLSAQEFADALVHRSLSRGMRRDDSLALALRRGGPPARRFDWTLSPSGKSLAEARRDMAAWLRGHSVAETDASELVLALSELAANALKAARSTVTVSAMIDSDVVRLAVSDDGEGEPALHAAGKDLPAADAPGGRGLYVVRSILQGVQVRTSGDGTTVEGTRKVMLATDRYGTWERHGKLRI